MLNLLQFNAGVDLSIDEVRLLIEKVNAKVLLEARLENLVKMINSTLSSIDLNPIIATLGDDVGSIVNNTVGGLTGSSSSGTGTAAATGTASSAASSTTGVDKRSYDITHNGALDVGYRYLNLGDAVAKDPDYDGRIKYKDIAAHEVRVGLRYTFGDGNKAF